MKLRNKLILSCAALAAVATTAFSTTFAWYTANDSVKANNITGKTSTQDATLLLISTTGKTGQWGASVDIDSTAITLDPVAYMQADKYVRAYTYDANATYYTKSGSTYSEATTAPADLDAVKAGEFYFKKEAGKYYQWDSANNQEGAEATGGTAAGQYISFYLYFKSGSAASLSVAIKTFNLRNTTKVDNVVTLPTNTVLAAGTGSGSSTYSVDMLKATNVVMTVEQGTEVAVASTSPVVTNAGVRTAYAADSAHDATTYPDTIGNDANAHTYYNNVKTLVSPYALDDTIVSSETGATYSTVATLQNDFTFATPTGAGATGTLDSILMVKFDIYLDGWDKLCFDACRKQTFALDMEFTGAPYVAPSNNSGSGSGSGN